MGVPRGVEPGADLCRKARRQPGDRAGCEIVGADAVVAVVARGAVAGDEAEAGGELGVGEQRGGEGAVAGVHALNTRERELPGPVRGFSCMRQG